MSHDFACSPQAREGNYFHLLCMIYVTKNWVGPENKNTEHSFHVQID